ncbi:VOC family protein [Sphingomonas sp. SUN039]|uniref:VOC family protein n=1 Tax=Sphingomonas sp. SUN039 TaxID=2937787 RepID=UPI00216417BE|nr:VOC family protein [Sphingomonas sp. SUN039]UVO52648.1 VOC family protein [Sphingomonas sp. SUN039]
MRRIAALLLAVAAIPATAQELPTLIGPSLRTSTIDTSLRFYTAGLGMVVVAEIPRGTAREIILGFSKEHPQPGIILLNEGKSGAKIVQGNGLSRIALRVPDLDAIAARLKAAGYAPSPIRDVMKGYRIMTIADPDGYLFELVERRISPEPSHAPQH